MQRRLHVAVREDVHGRLEQPFRDRVAVRKVQVLDPLEMQSVALDEGREVRLRAGFPEQLVHHFHEAEVALVVVVEAGG